MPKWIEKRKEHILSKNPDMPESMAWGIATQQGHALGKTPKGYGTEEGRAKAKAKYPKPRSYKKTASLEDEIRRALGDEARVISDNPTPGSYLRQKLHKVLPPPIAEIGKIGSIHLRAFGEELVNPKLASIPAEPPSRLSKFMTGVKHEAGPAIGATLGAGIANAYGVSPLAGAAAGYGLGALPDILYAMRHKIAEYGGPGPMELPENHSAGISVPKGGSSCANCKYAQVRDDGPHCTNEYYQQWAGTSELVDPDTGERVLDPSTYCSNWWEEGKPTTAKEGSVLRSAHRAGQLISGSRLKRIGEAKERIQSAGRSAINKAMSGSGSAGSYDRHRRAIKRVGVLEQTEKANVSKARKNTAIAAGGTAVGLGGAAALNKEGAKVGPIKRIGELITHSRYKRLMNAADKHIGIASRKTRSAVPGADLSEMTNAAVNKARLNPFPDRGVETAKSFLRQEGNRLDDMSKALRSSRRHARAAGRLVDLAEREDKKIGLTYGLMAASGAAALTGGGMYAASRINKAKKSNTKEASDSKSDAELKEVGRQRAVTNLAAEAHREAGRRGERAGQAIGGVAGALTGAAAGKKLLSGRTGAIAGMAAGYLAGSRAGKEIGTERDIKKNAFSYSQYGGQPAQNPPGKRMASYLPPFSAPPIEAKEAGLGQTLSLLTKQAGIAFSDRIPGGLADEKKPGQFDKRQIAKGVKHELEHTDSKAVAREISMDHLVEDPKYYTKLDKIEEKKAGVGVGSGFSTSQYSGPLSYGPFKMTSGIPPFTAPAMTKADPRAGGGSAWMVGADKMAAPASPGTTGQALTPAGNLRLTQQVGAPKITAPGGPSISEISKPQGFGTPLAGTTKI